MNVKATALLPLRLLAKDDTVTTQFLSLHCALGQVHHADVSVSEQLPLW